MSGEIAGQGPVGGPALLSGEGTPEGKVTAQTGSIYRRTDGGVGSTLYVKEAGADNTSTGWIAHGGNPAGTIIDWAGTGAVPSGYLLCYGQSLATATYPDLFGAIGYTYGGSGANFNVPDCRGRVAAAQDNMGGTAANRLRASVGGVDGLTVGAAGGAEYHYLTTDQIPSHQHAGVDHLHYVPGVDHLHYVPNHQHYSGGCYPEFTGSGRGAGTSFSLVSGRWTDAGYGACWSGAADRSLATNTYGADRSLTTGATGNGNWHPNVQATIVFRKLIKT